MTVYLIDGYNLIHQMLRPESSNPRTGPTDRVQIPNLDHERSRIIDQIASYIGSTDARAIVVFDSQSETLQNIESATSKVEVYFGSFDRSADSIIEHEVYALNAGENVVVVTSDWGLQKVVSRPNVARRSSRQFLKDLQAHTKKIANSRDCTTIGNRVEDRIAPGMLDKLKALREQLEEEPPD